MKTLILVLTPIFLFTSCKKYPDGGSVKKAPKNIVGQWTLKLYEVNGIDSTDLINYNRNEGYKNIIVSKLKTSNSSYVFKIDNQVGLGFNINEKDQSITVNSSYTSIYCPNITKACYKIIFSPEGGNLNWAVFKLTKNELILKANLRHIYV